MYTNFRRKIIFIYIYEKKVETPRIKAPFTGVDDDTNIFINYLIIHK